MSEATLPAALRIAPLVEGNVSLGELDDTVRTWSEK